MLIRIGGEKKPYDHKLVKQCAIDRFPKGQYLQPLLRDYPKDESEFSSIFVKLFQVPSGYSVVYTVGGEVVGARPTRGAGYRFMIGLGGLIQSAYVVNTGIQKERLVTQDILTKDNVKLKNIDFEIAYRLKDPEKAVRENQIDEYRDTTYVFAEKRVNNYVGNNTLESLVEVDEVLAMTTKGKQIVDTGGRPLKVLNYKERNLTYDVFTTGDKSVPPVLKKAKFPTLEKIGIELIDLFVLDNPVDDDIAKLVLGRIIGRTERQKREHLAEAEYTEIVRRGEAVANAGRAIQNVPGALVLSTLEVYQDFAQGPNNTFVTMPELKVNLSPQTDFSPRPDNMPGGPIYQPPEPGSDDVSESNKRTKNDSGSDK